MGPLDRLLGFIRGRDKSDAIGNLECVPASANPFGIEIWDCRSFTQTMISTTGDPRVAEGFVALRRSAGTEHVNQSVANAQTVACDLVYAFDSSMADGPVFKADSMEDKWDIYMFRPHLYFARSWSGILQYRSHVRVEPGRLRATNIEVARDQDPEFAQRVVDYLFKSHIVGAVVPHPLPSDLPRDSDAIAAFSFSLFGRRCHYGSFADTIAAHPAGAPGLRS